MTDKGEEYLVAVRTNSPEAAAAMASLMAEAESSPDLRIARSPAGGSAPAVVIMPAPVADALRQRYGAQLVIELNAPLTHF
ncbi:hypothetical protein [Arenibaculum pallidiluteum]|uniref:hypothetical protein n=1 Tax=Arenibaculum pallidiluteum TaxID=2812559 RepID=UPI001A96C0D0|nr:hypothetical protein [Arenibaculum pallidiluteum]